MSKRWADLRARHFTPEHIVASDKRVAEELAEMRKAELENEVKVIEMLIKAYVSQDLSPDRLAAILGMLEGITSDLREALYPFGQPADR